MVDSNSILKYFKQQCDSLSCLTLQKKPGLSKTSSVAWVLAMPTELRAKGFPILITLTAYF